MKIIGLTGSIASGKSTTSRMLKRMRIPVHDADQCVHDLMARNGAATPIILDIFPQSADDHGGIDRGKLRDIVFKDNPEHRAVLESILHPMVRESANRFIRNHRRNRRKICVLDIPLLFETNGQGRCDAVWCTSAPRSTQKHRLMRRNNMTAATAAAIIKAQWPQAEKIRRSDQVIPSARGRNFVARLLRTLTK